MTNILKVDSSMRTDSSVSRKLTAQLVEKLALNESHEVVERDLTDGVPFIDEAWINASYAQADSLSDEEKNALSESDQLIHELKQADVLVIGAPIYNFGVPAALKAWIDQVARAKVTFKYTEQGPVGLLKNKKAYVVVTSGGVPVGSEVDFVSNYMKQVLGFIGIKDVTIIDAGGLAIDELEAITRAESEIQAA